jgi:uncharacterized membrane protein
MAGTYVVPVSQEAAVSVVISTRHTGDQLSSVLARSRARMQMNVGATERWLSIAAGGLLAAYAIRRRSPGAAVAAIASAGLLFRGVTGHCSIKQAIHDLNGDGQPGEHVSETRARLGGGGGLLVDESIDIGRPIADVYQFWRKLENLPQFMGHLESVTARSDGTSHWVARGPAGIPVEWDARVINDVENKILGWQSLDGSAVATAGSVNFRQTPTGTHVHVRFQYDPPAGKVGAKIAALLGDDAGRAVRDELAKLKTLLEQSDVNPPRYSPSRPSV